MAGEDTEEVLGEMGEVVVGGTTIGGDEAVTRIEGGEEEGVGGKISGGAKSRRIVRTRRLKKRDVALTPSWML